MHCNYNSIVTPQRCHVKGFVRTAATLSAIIPQPHSPFHPEPPMPTATQVLAGLQTEWATYVARFHQQAPATQTARLSIQHLQMAIRQ